MVYKFSDINVLIVDSEPVMGELIRQVLYDFGARAHVETDGKSGLRYFEKGTSDLIIVDGHLDSMSGVEFTKAVRNSHKNPYVPIIFMTSLTSKDRVVLARDSGITEFLKKPFSAISLYKRIERIVENPRPFVRCENFFGPDRRSEKKGPFGGPDRRICTPVVEKISNSPLLLKNAERRA